MAVSAATPLPPILSPNRLTTITTTSSNLASSCCPKYNYNDIPLMVSFPSETSTSTARKRPSISTFAQKSRTGLANDQKRELLEQYGLNPDEFLSEPSPKVNIHLSVYMKIYVNYMFDNLLFANVVLLTRRRKEMEKTRRGKQVPSEEMRPPRETHKLLQVLGGKAQRKKLLSPNGMDVRPMMEVVKGAAFSMLQAAGGCPASLRPGRWLDLYSGTGSVGIEALSLGCTEVHFVEMDPWVVSDILRPNLEWTGFLDVSVIHAVRVENFLERAEQFVGKDGPFDYVSVTPPYTQVDYGVLMNQISNSSLIGEDTLIVVEYPLRTDMLDACGCLTKIANRRFGRTHLAIYGPKWAQKKRKSELSNRVVAENV